MNKVRHTAPQEAAGPKMKQIRCIAWNVRGWRGERSERGKIRRIKGEIEDYDIFILTETHLSADAKVIDKFEQNMPEFLLFHAHAEGNQASARLGVTIGVRKTLTDRDRISVSTEEAGEKGRWLRLTITGVLPKPLHTWGVYAPAGKVAARKQ